MPASFTVIYTHPSGATATFIYENGELSALAKGLDAEQFWEFKQVKALLLRNEDGDIALSNQMMARLGFEAQVIRALPDLLAPIDALPILPNGEEEIPSEYRFRSLPNPYAEFPMYRGPRLDHGEVHWRESEQPTEPSAWRAPALPQPEPAKPVGPVKPWNRQPPLAAHGEIHWRGDH